MVSGDVCGSPALTDSNLCYWHHKARARRRHRDKIAGPVSNPGIVLPTLEDAASIQIGIQEIAHAILDRRLDDKRAGLLLYAMQLASNNVHHLDPPSVDGSIACIGDDVDAIEEDEVDSEDEEEDSDEEDSDDDAEEDDSDEEETDDDGTSVDAPDTEVPAPEPPKKKPVVDFEVLARVEERLRAKGLCGKAEP